MVKEIIKRDGRRIPYDESKIQAAIFKAATEVAKKEGSIASYEMAGKLAAQVTKNIEKNYKDAPTVEQIQDEVVKVLIKNNLDKISVCYILYREERNKKRNIPQSFGLTIQT